VASDEGPIMVAGVPLRVLLDRIALGGIAFGFLLVFQPWGGTLRSGFFVTFLSTLLHVVTSHVEMPKTNADGEAEKDGSKTA
jgi:hypothetical protein